MYKIMIYADFVQNLTFTGHFMHLYAFLGMTLISQTPLQ